MNKELLKRANQQAENLNALLKPIVPNVGEKIDTTAMFSSTIGCHFCQFSNAFYVYIPDNLPKLLEQIKTTFKSYEVVVNDRSSVGENGWLQIIASV